MMLNLFFWKKGSRGSKGQGALEYLLIIGAAILIAAIVVTILVKTTKTTEGSVDKVYGDFNKVISDINYDIDNNDISLDTAVCDDDVCFKTYFADCNSFSYISTNQDSKDKYTIYGPNGDFCKLKIEILEVLNTDNIDKSVKGLTMVCDVNNEKTLNNALGHAICTQKCSGVLYTQFYSKIVGAKECDQVDYYFR